MTTVIGEPVAAAQMPLMDHIRELRNRLLKSLGAVFLGAFIAFLRYDSIQTWLLGYYKQASRGVLKFSNLGPLEGVTDRAQICMYVGLFGASPIWLWQLWSFISPALNKREKKYAIPFLVSSIVLFIGGAIVALLTLPPGLQFLVNFAGKETQPIWSMQKMTSLVTLMVLGFGFAFLFPVVLVFLQLVHVLKSKQLLKQWRYWIVGIFVAAAVITPSQDPFTFFAMALPMVLFYFGSILIGRLLKR
jgi:sec-independent protein translocase protein TatC